MTQDELKQLLHYSPDTGEFTWLKITSTKIKVGDMAGCLHKSNGYRHIKINNKPYKEHRLAWLYVHGSLPTHDIDHINGVRDDNRINNLREATHSENQQNRIKQKNNSSGFTNVTWYKQRNKWKSYIAKNGKQIFLGYFDTPDEAYDEYLKAKSQLHTFNPTPR
jgi:hypothetical protein